MKLFRHGPIGQEQPGVVINDRHKDVSAFGEDYNETFFDKDGLARLETWLQTNSNSCPEVNDSVRLGSAICRPSKILCIGLNYRMHALETGAKLPEEPVVFSKATSAFSGPFDNVRLPRGSENSDWEVELAVVIGKKASYVEEKEALDFIAGYGVMNDYSERHYQKDQGGQWVKGKSADTFAPFGPYLVTKDEVADPGSLHLWLKLNNEMKQDSTTSDLIFSVPFIISYLSRFMSLLPGDIISTGTPSGVGLGHKPPVFLKPGDVVEYGIDGLGTAKQVVEG